MEDFKKRGSFRKIQEDWLVKNKLINEGRKLTEDYGDIVDEAVRDFYSSVEGAMNDIGSEVEEFWDNDNYDKAIKLLNKCEGDIYKAVNKYKKMIVRL